MYSFLDHDSLALTIFCLSVPLTVTKKKSYDTKKELVSEIQDCCDKYAHIFLIEVHNERNNLLKEIRESWKHSRYETFCFKFNLNLLH